MSRNEQQTREQLIDEKLHPRGWTEALISREQTAGGVDIIDGKPVKRRGRTDYLLCLPAPTGGRPLKVALIEAKDDSTIPDLAIGQAKRDGRLHVVPFVFSTNGHLFVEYGEDTRQISRPRPLEEIPTPDQLRQRFEAYTKLRLDEQTVRALFERYKGGEAVVRYYQDAAIRAAIMKMARGGNRVLMSQATGTGKTIIAAQLLHKLNAAGQLRRALFVCDRDELRTQGMSKIHAVIGDDAQIVTTREPRLNARVLIASYQTLNITDDDAEPSFWKEQYPPGFFSHIIIDECHRSAWGKWSVILTDNPDAVHIGLTATPRIVVGGKKDSDARRADEEITNHNIKYFGEPVYEYPLAQGQDDGYLAACEIIQRVVDLDKREITREDIEARTATDAVTGKAVDPADLQERYNAKEYEAKIMLPDRVRAMCEDFFKHLLDTGGPHQKTIIFCARDAHATAVTNELNNIYNRWCAATGNVPKEDYAFQCTGNPSLRPPASQTLPDFKASANSHFIATTVDLLSTGVDIERLQNVVFFRYLESPITFYQMVGRGTRIYIPTGKLMFRLYDYTECVRLFGRPFESRARPTTESGEERGREREAGYEVGGEEEGSARLVKVEGFNVQTSAAGHAVLCQRDGRDVPVPLDEYKQELAARVQAEAPTLDDLRERWINRATRRAFLDALPGGEGSVRLVRALDDMEACDLYDVLADLTYGVAARSRSERAASFTYKQRQWLRQLPDSTAKVLTAVASQFAKGGMEELETQHLFDAPDVTAAGGFQTLVGLPLEPGDLLHATKERILAP